MEKSEQEEFVLIGAGLPRTGTMSTRAALREVLGGDIYHMETVAMERPDHHKLWWKALDGSITKSEWRVLLSDYRGGVDYPISFFYKEIMTVFPNAKVLLNVRDPAKWYDSVRGSILQLMTTANSWPCTWLTSVLGIKENMSLVDALSRPVPSCSTIGQGMFGAVEEGRETAVKFYEEHVAEVKKVVPEEKLLVWEVKEGWGPLCKFLGVAEPSTPFPRVNDTSEILSARRDIMIASWVVMVILPMVIVSLALVYNWDMLVVLGGYLVILLILRILNIKLSSSGGTKKNQ